jgi:hemerythrin superfamily protein
MAASKSPEAAQELEAIAMLRSDHKKVKALFQEFAKLKENGSDEQKMRLVKKLCEALKIHAAIEEEIFYPAVRKAIEDGALMDEALVEHAGAKDLVAQLEEMDPDADLYDAKVTVLGEQIDHHVKEEEGEMFPQVKKAKVDTAALGAKMARRQAQLHTELGIDAGEEQIREKSAVLSRRGSR